MLKKQLSIFNLLFFFLCTIFTPLGFANIQPHVLPKSAVPPLIVLAGANEVNPTTDPLFYPLIVTSLDGGNTWNQIPSLGADLGTFYSSSCTASGATCLAAGGDFVSETPYLAVGTRGGTNWNVATFPPIAAGHFTSSSCTDASPSAFCTVVGINDSGGGEIPIIIASVNGGSSWTIPSVSLPASGTLEGASCTGGTICMAVGTAPNGSATLPFIILSANQGGSWAVQTVSGVSYPIFLHSGSCTGSGTSAICVAAGEEEISSSDDVPVIVTGNNGSGTWSWSVSPVSDLPTGVGLFEAASCTGSGASAVCVASGKVANAPVLAVSTNGGTLWTYQPVSGLPSSGGIRSVSCSSGTGYTICAAAGPDVISGSGYPFVVASIDGGHTWSMEYIPDLIGIGILPAASCSGSGPTGVCTVGGFTVMSLSYTPLLITSLNGGLTWGIQEPAALPANGMIYNAASSASTSASLANKIFKFLHPAA